jgi:hypothetical protein
MFYFNTCSKRGASCISNLKQQVFKKAPIVNHGRGFFLFCFAAAEVYKNTILNLFCGNFLTIFEHLKGKVLIFPHTSVKGKTCHTLKRSKKVKKTWLHTFPCFSMCVLAVA